jgi:hypothetical protein
MSLHQKVTDLSAKEIEGEQGFQDVTTALENARQEIADAAQQADAALKDNATQGGSTGGGSGATKCLTSQPKLSHGTSRTREAIDELKQDQYVLELEERIKDLILRWVGTSGIIPRRRSS